VVTDNSGLVSVIIPVYNSAHYLGTALRSVFQQRYQPVEVIVINDGSTDDLGAVLAELQRQIPGGYAAHSKTSIRYCEQPNAGPASARNRGVALANGSLLAFLDADDWWHPEKLQRQVDRLCQEPTLGYVLSHMAVHLETATAWPVSLNQAHYRNEPPCILPSALLVWRTIFEQVGNFDEHYRYSDDADWFLRAKDAAIPFAVLPERLVYKRIHATNLSHTPAMAQETLRAFHTSIQRQRRQPSTAGVTTLKEQQP
jgi:glycosyltransferase involved in cell wall biosynthesis